MQRYNNNLNFQTKTHKNHYSHVSEISDMGEDTKRAVDVLEVIKSRIFWLKDENRLGGTRRQYCLCLQFRICFLVDTDDFFRVDTFNYSLDCLPVGMA